MANWKFTDQYGTIYPALANSILATLVFDVPQGSSPVSGTTFSASLDLGATGTVMKVLTRLLGLSSIPMNGTVTATAESLSVDLQPVDNTAITAALAKCIPIVGGQIMQSASLSIQNLTDAALTVDDDPTTDEFDIDVKISIAGKTAELSAQVPMGDGLFSLSADLTGFSVNFSDLNFLINGGPFSALFPTTLPKSWFTSGSTQLTLNTLGFSLMVNTSSGLSVTVSTLSVVLGIGNIPLYKNALFLNPLGVSLVINSPTNKPTVSWSLTAAAMLYRYGQQTNPPSSPADFTFNMDLDVPGAGDTTINISGDLENPDSLSVATMIADFMNDSGFNTGISSQITIDAFAFDTTADTSTGTITSFSFNAGMSSPVGIFAAAGFGIKDFSIAIDYSS